MKTRFPIIEHAKMQARMCFLGIAIPCYKTTVDGNTIRSEKVLKFNRKSLRKMNKPKTEKANPRFIGGDDNMIIKVGKPGSRERIEALKSQYEAFANSNNESSPFADN